DARIRGLADMDDTCRRAAQPRPDDCDCECDLGRRKYRHARISHACIQHARDRAGRGRRRCRGAPGNRAVYCLSAYGPREFVTNNAGGNSMNASIHAVWNALMTASWRSIPATVLLIAGAAMLVWGLHAFFKPIGPVWMRGFRRAVIGLG